MPHPDEKFPKIREMAKAAQAMVTEAVDAYVKQDLELARKVMSHDDVVDRYFTQVKNGIIEMIAADPSQSEYALDLLMIASILSGLATIAPILRSGWNSPLPAFMRTANK